MPKLLNVVIGLYRVARQPHNVAAKVMEDGLKKYVSDLNESSMNLTRLTKRAFYGTKPKYDLSELKPPSVDRITSVKELNNYCRYASETKTSMIEMILGLTAFATYKNYESVSEYLEKLAASAHEFENEVAETVSALDADLKKAEADLAKSGLEKDRLQAEQKRLRECHTTALDRFMGWSEKEKAKVGTALAECDQNIDSLRDVVKQKNEQLGIAKGRLTDLKIHAQMEQWNFD